MNKRLFTELVTVTCPHCQEEAEVAMYFYDPEIIMQDHPGLFVNCYKAKVSGRAICPCCGREIVENYWDDITKKDITNLAMGVNKHGGI